MGEKNPITVVSETTEIQSLRSQFVCFVKLTAEITRNYFQQKMTGFWLSVSKITALFAIVL